MSKLKVSIKKSTVTAMMKAGRKERINETGYNATDNHRNVSTKGNQRQLFGTMPGALGAGSM